jgi:hypothetical protein
LRRDDDHGLAVLDEHGPAGLLGDFACGESKGMTSNFA